MADQVNICVVVETQSNKLVSLFLENYSGNILLRLEFNYPYNNTSMTSFDLIFWASKIQFPYVHGQNNCKITV